MKLLSMPKFKLSMVNLLNVAGAVGIVYLVVILAQTIENNYALNKQITGLKTQMSLLQDQKDELAYNIQYYQTNSFQEREARSKLGMQLPGEQVVALPSPSVSPTPALEVTKPVKAKSNWQQWLDFLSGKG